MHPPLLFLLSFLVVLLRRYVSATSAHPVPRNTSVNGGGKIRSFCLSVIGGENPPRPRARVGR